MWLKKLFFGILQMMNISFWNMKQKSPKLPLTVGKKGRYHPFWCFFESNFLLMISPSFCKCCSGFTINSYAGSSFSEMYLAKPTVAFFLLFLFLLPRHKLTRHQYYLQLRKDILEDRLYCNEETGLFLAALALQAEFGDYMSEVQRT